MPLITSLDNYTWLPKLSGCADEVLITARLREVTNVLLSASHQVSYIPDSQHESHPDAGVNEAADARGFLV